MNSPILPSILSFVIRFVVDSPVDNGRSYISYRGTIRHIQTDEEINFSNWEEAVAFIERFVPLETNREAGSK